MGVLQKLRNFFVLEEGELPDEHESEKPRWRGKLVNLTSSRNNTIILVEPTSIVEAQEVGDHLKNRTAVVINLHGLEQDLATRILDFTSGMTYALSGTLQKISDAIYLFAPPTFTVIAAPKKVGYTETTELFFSSR